MSISNFLFLDCDRTSATWFTNPSGSDFTNINGYYTIEISGFTHKNAYGFYNVVRTSTVTARVRRLLPNKEYYVEIYMYDKGRNYAWVYLNRWHTVRQQQNVRIMNIKTRSSNDGTIGIGFKHFNHTYPVAIVTALSIRETPICSISVKGKLLQAREKIYKMRYQFYSILQ